MSAKERWQKNFKSLNNNANFAEKTIHFVRKIEMQMKRVEKFNFDE